MNSDDSTTYSSFGIDDPLINPTASEREQQRWVDAVSAVIAVDGSKPIYPSTTLQNAIQWRIDAPVRSLRRMRLLAWSGWAAAAMVFAGFFLIDSRREVVNVNDPAPSLPKPLIAEQKEMPLPVADSSPAAKEEIAQVNERVHAEQNLQAIQE